MIREAISKLSLYKSLSFGQARTVFEEIFDQKAHPVQIAAFLVALRMKQETEEEISAAATVVRERARKIKARSSLLGTEDTSEPIMDTCGTGGSGLNKFNISTATAFVVSAAGIKVAKHGNRAMSSSCGSADVLEALGININVSSEIMQKALHTVGIAFLYAPLYHPALKEVAGIRRQMGIRTIFNILGPLCNPAFASHQLLGVYDSKLTLVLARVLKKLGSQRALVVCGRDLKDEVSLSGPTKAAFLNRKQIKSLILTPSSFGLRKIALKGIMAKDASFSAKMIRDIFKGKAGPGRDIVLANASACFYVAGKAGNFKQGSRLAAQLIDEGKAQEQLQRFKDFLDNNA
jgi:anthranilate phosphoribosyltransferase